MKDKPDDTFLYRHFNARGELLYIGVSLSVAYRLSQHKDYSPWFKEISTVTIERFANRVDALKAETEAIKRERPKFNVLFNQRKEPEAERHSRAEMQKLALMAEVLLKPVYSIESAAQLLELRSIQVRHLIERGELGHFTVPPRGNAINPKVRISGWQIIDYLEAQGAIDVRSTRKLAQTANGKKPTPGAVGQISLNL